MTSRLLRHSDVYFFVYLQRVWFNGLWRLVVSKFLNILLQIKMKLQHYTDIDSVSLNNLNASYFKLFNKLTCRFILSFVCNAKLKDSDVYSRISLVNQTRSDYIRIYCNLKQFTHINKSKNICLSMVKYFQKSFN